MNAERKPILRLAAEFAVMVEQLSERTYRSCNLARFHDEYEARLNALGEALDAAR